MTHARETNRLVRGRFAHPHLHCLQSSLSQYDAAWVKFIFEILQTYLLSPAVSSGFFLFFFLFFFSLICERHVDSAKVGKCP